jgi:hypothetical protein
MRQAGRPVAGLEDHLVFRLPLQPRHDLARFLERPGIGGFGQFAQRGRARHGDPFGARKLKSAQHGVKWR